MKTIQYILGIIVFTCFGHTLHGQTITSINPDPVCMGELVTITGTNMDDAYLKLIKTGGGGTTIDLSSNITSGSKTEIIVQLPTNLSISGNLDFEVRKHNDNTKFADKSFTLNELPEASINIIGGINIICVGENRDIEFDISNIKNNEDVKVYYTLNGAVKDTTINLGTHTILSNITSTTTCTINSVENLTTGCVATLSSTSVSLTAIPSISGTLTTTTNTICEGQSTILIFNINNPNGDNMEVTYEIDGTPQTPFTTNGTLHTITENPTATTTYKLTNIKNTSQGNCQETITTNNEETVTVHKTPQAAMNLTSSTQICNGEDVTLELKNNTTSGDLIKIYYNEGGTSKSIVIENDTTITFSNVTSSTTYQLTGVELELYGCYQNITAAPIAVTVVPVITGTLAASSTSICNGENITLFFSANNPNGDNLKFYYSDGTNNYDVSTTSTFITVPSPNLTTSPTTFTLQSIENVTQNCSENITTNNTVTITVSNTMGVTVSTSASSICYGESYDLNFTITGRTATDNVKITYSKDNITLDTTAAADLITVPSSDTLTTLFSLISIENLTTGCVKNYTPNAVNSTLVNVTPQIAASISTANNTICEGENTNLIFSIDNPNLELIKIIYQYNDANGNIIPDTVETNSTSKSIAISPSTSTTYSLVKVKTVACENVVSGSVSITVNKVPDATLTGGGISCNFGLVALNFNITNKVANDLVTVTYLEGGQLKSLSTRGTTIDTLVAPLATTVYPLISVTNNTVGCTNNAVSGAVTVESVNGLSAEINASSNEICVGESVTLSFVVNNWVNPSRIIYKAGNVQDTVIAMGATTLVTVFPQSTTVYELISIENIDKSCPAISYGTTIQTVVVNPLPEISLTGNATICNTSITPINFALSGGTAPYTVNYLQNQGGGVTNLSISTHNSTSVNVAPNNDAFYLITSLIDSKGCQDQQLLDTAQVIVHPLPTAQISVDDNTLCRGDIVNLNFTVGNNEGQDVIISYNSVTNGVSTAYTITTDSTIILSLSPDSTTTYEITNIQNAITNCVGPLGNNNSALVAVNQLPTVTPSVSSATAVVCDGSNTFINFLFPVGVPPFEVFYTDSFSLSLTRSAVSSWQGLTSGASIAEAQNNNTTGSIDHTYFVGAVQDGNGCITDFPIGNEPFVNVDINPTPALTINGLQDMIQPYASTDSDPYQLQGIPWGGLFTGAGVGITLNDQPNGYSTANFVPNNAGFLPTDITRDIEIAYTYTESATGCTGVQKDTVRLKKALKYTFYNENETTLETTYCRNSDSLHIYAKVDGTEPIGNNTFNLDSTNNIVFSNVQLQGDSVRVTLAPIHATGTFPLRFGSVATGFITKQITIIDTINTLFSPFIDGIYFCQDSLEEIRLIGIPSADVTSPTGVFSSPTFDIIRADSSGGINEGWYVKQKFAGWHTVIYTYEDTATGCITRSTQTVEISPAPVANYETTIACNDKVTSFIDISTFTQDPMGVDSLVNWEWTFGDGFSYADTIKIDTLPHQYSSSAVYIATLDVTSQRGCESTFTDTFVVGNIPLADFGWRFATFGNDTRFVNTSPNLSPIGAGQNQRPNYIDSLKWNFGDGIISNKNAIADIDTILHEYTAIGNYQAVLYSYTNNGCEDSDTMEVYILPKVDTYPYYERFDNSDGGWIANPVEENYWAWGNPHKDNIKHNDPLNKAWITDLDSVYVTGEDIWVYSPTFDFTTIERPMVAFRYWCDTRVSDGAVLQYSIDSVSTPWNVLGEDGTGLGWYDVRDVVAQPGNQSGFNGFAWSQENTGWQVARHKLDVLKGQPAVRFRIAFASVAGTNNNYDGFSFDDFWVGNRQKQVLIESFTHIENDDYVDVQNSIYQKIDDNDSDVLLVEYHNDIPNDGGFGNDNFNLFNQADPSARVLYYQFSETGKTVIDGGIPNTTITTAGGVNLGWTQQDLDLAMLEEPIFHIGIDNFSTANNVLNVTATIKARKPMPANLRKVYIAIVEDDVNEDMYLHKKVLRKLLPSAAGSSLTNAWSIGTAQSITESWAIPSGVTASNLKAIIWIQSNQTKHVYQVALAPVVGTPVPYDSTVVNTEKPLDITEETAFSLFPNPTNGNFTVEFDAPTNIDAQWQLVDVSGRIVQQDNVPPFTRSIFIQTEGIAKGLYFFRLVNAEGVSTVRKILVK